MLLVNMVKSVCGCKVVEGQNETDGSCASPCPAPTQGPGWTLTDGQDMDCCTGAGIEVPLAKYCPEDSVPVCAGGN